MKMWPTPDSKLSWSRVLWAIALIGYVVLSALGALRGGYVGPDYWTHIARILDHTRFFDYAMADPPIYVLLGNGLFQLIGKKVSTDRRKLVESILQPSKEIAPQYFVWQVQTDDGRTF